MCNHLFDEFDTVSSKEWKQKIQFQLNGADYNRALLRQTPEGVTIKPFYTKEIQKTCQSDQSTSSFDTCQTVFVADVAVANSIALEALSKGVKTILFVASQEFEYKKLLQNLNVSSLYFSFSFFSPNFIDKISRSYPSINIYFDTDIIGNLARTGNWFYNLKQDFELLQNSVKTLDTCLQVDASIYQNAGANIVQQLAYALAHANEYLNYLGENSVRKIHFKFSVGSDFFLEIAKFRAFNILWRLLTQEYGFEQDYSHVFAEPTLRNKTLFDARKNLLRTHSECMSAILGGVHTVHNIPFDSFFKKSNQYSSKLAREQLLWFQNNSSFSTSQKIVDGAYYVDSLTEQLAQRALDIFKQIEKGGGFLKQLKEGVVQEKIKESADKEQLIFDKKHSEFKYKKEALKDETELYPFVKFQKRKTLIHPIIPSRLSEKKEKELLRNG